MRFGGPTGVDDATGSARPTLIPGVAHDAYDRLASRHGTFTSMRIMISYSRPQRDLAEVLHARLQDAGHAPKLDCLDISMGERFAQTLAWWLSACHAAVVLLSREALASPWVRYELGVLVNRMRLDDDVALLSVLVGGVTERDVAGCRELEPLELDALQLRTLEEDEGARFDGVVAAIDKLSTGSTGIGPLVESFHEHVAPAQVGRIAKARRHLARTDRDPWFDDAEIADRSDDGKRLKWALAHELSAHTLHDLYGPLQELAQGPEMRGSMGKLVDLSLTTTLDCAAIGALHAATRAPCEPVVLGLTAADLAKLAAEAIGLRPKTNFVFAYGVDVQVTASSIAGYGAAIARQVLREIDPDEETAERELREVLADHPVIVVLRRAEGLTRPILDDLRTRLPGIAFVVVASRHVDPEAWSERLERAPIAGPRLRGEAWSAFVDAEDALVARARSTRGNLNRVIKKAHP